MRLGCNIYETYSQRRFSKGAKTGDKMTTGWLPPLPDMRDYSEDHPVIVELSEKLGIDKKPKRLPRAVDLRKWCSPVEDQLSLGSCTANAAVGMVEYFQKRAFGMHLEGSYVVKDRCPDKNNLLAYCHASL